MEGLKLWNRLGNSDQVTNSRVGPNGTEIGSPDYADAKFGAGVQHLSSGANFPSFPYALATMPQDDFTVEFWWTPNYNSDASYNMLVDVGSSPSQSERFYFDVGDQLSQNSISLMTRDSSTYRCQYAWAWSFSADVPVHIAGTFSSSGGALGRSKLYLDGVDQGAGTIFTGKDALWTFTQEETLQPCCGLNTTVHLCKGPIDNLKIWDFVKTDYSDRFYEGFDYNKKRRTS